MLGGDVNGVQFKDFCWQEWKSKYGTSPPWSKKEFAQLHDARQRLDTEELARTSWLAFLQADGPYFEGHSPGQFLSNLSRMTARAVKAIPKKQEQGTQVMDAIRAKADRMARIYAEVEKDDSIPPDQKIAERSRRWKGL